MKKWKLNAPQRDVVSRLATGCGVTTLAAAALAARGHSSPDSVMEKLQADGLSDPFLIKDMQKAADIINEALDTGKKICIYGDYDCDGVTATAILYSYLTEAGADVFCYIPERSEGYGLNTNAIDKISAKGTELIITVDNGISAVAEADYIYILGMKLIITDHHQPGETIPKAEAVVDPHQKDDLSPFKYACGAVVALKLIAALDGGDYTFALEQFGDLAALATVADIVSLTGENRYIVSYGMERINNTDRPGLMALKEVSGYADKPIDSQGIGFGLAPRINVAGRLGSPSTALKLLLCEDYDEALDIAREIDVLNTRRKDAEAEIMAEVYEMADSDPSILRGRVIFVCGKGWNHGIIGIVASKIVDKFGKPCFIASEENGEIRGSARTVGDFSIFAALTAASDALSKFGGHPGAGGFSIKHGQQEKFRTLLEKYALENHKDMPEAELSADCPVTAPELNVENIRGLDVLEPFGMDNEKPLFYIENAQILDIFPLSGGLHSKLSFKLGYTNAEAIYFRHSSGELTVARGDFCDMVVSLGVNEFRGNVSPSVYITDIRLHGFEQSRYFAGLRSFEAFMRGEALPKNYYPAMLPERDDSVKIYKNIPEGGIPFDTLYLKLKDNRLNYCRFCVAAEALRQSGLISISSEDSRIRRIPVTKRADLNAAPVLIELKKHI